MRATRDAVLWLLVVFTAAGGLAGARHDASPAPREQEPGRVVVRMSEAFAGPDADTGGLELRLSEGAAEG